MKTEKKTQHLWMCVIVWALKRIWNVENEFEFNEWFLNQSQTLKPHHSRIPHPATRFKVSRYTHESTTFYANTQIHASNMLTNTSKHEEYVCEQMWEENDIMNENVCLCEAGSTGNIKWYYIYIAYIFFLSFVCREIIKI